MHPQIEDADLIARAAAVAGEFPLAKPSLTAGSVGCALVTASGGVYTGICLDLACGIGFCAEHAAVAAMLLARERRVARIVAVNDRGRVLPPCGRCRELLMQVDAANLDGCTVLLPDGDSAPLRALLPSPWMAGVAARDADPSGAAPPGAEVT